MKSKEMEMLCLPDCRGNTQKIQMAVEQFIDKIREDSSQKNREIFAVMVLERRTDYPALKKLFTRMEIMS